MIGKRINYLSEEKVAILKRHLVDKIPVSDLCDEYSLHPTVFYRWQKEFFEHRAAAFEKESARQKNKEAERIKALEQKLQRKKRDALGADGRTPQVRENLGEI